MSGTEPPSIAKWILEHFTPGDQNDALIGDLLEEFRNGRSAGWYWRQVSTAIAFASLREIRTHWLVVLFAGLWTIPARAMWCFTFGLLVRRTEFFWKISYRDSLFFCMSVVVFLLLWSGLALYMLICCFSEQHLNMKRVGRGLWGGPLMFVLLSVPMNGLSSPLAIGQSPARLLPYFLSLVAAIWGIRSGVATKSKSLVS